MSLTLTVECSNHQTERQPPQSLDVLIDGIDDANRRHVQGVLERRGWVVQYNGEHMDTYCSKECAR